MTQIAQISSALKSVLSINLCKSVIQMINDIIKAHGGTIEVQTKINEGTIFTVYLPV